MAPPKPAAPPPHRRRLTHHCRPGFAIAQRDILQSQLSKRVDIEKPQSFTLFKRSMIAPLPLMTIVLLLMKREDSP